MTGEAALHQQFEAYLRKQGIPWSHDRMDKRTSANDSDPDFRCYLNGQVAFVEFKVGKNKLSPVQKERIEELETAGNAVCVAYDLQTAVSHVEAQLMPGAATGHPAGPEGASVAQPKLWLAKSRDLGDVVVERNPQTGAMGFRRLAKPEDMLLPRWTELMG